VVDQRLRELATGVAAIDEHLVPRTSSSVDMEDDGMQPPAATSRPEVTCAPAQ